MSERSPQTSSIETKRSTFANRCKKIGASAAAGALFSVGGLVGSRPEGQSTYTAPHMQILHDGNVCPPEAQFGVINFAGAGKEDTSLYAGLVTKTILGEQYDECEAAFRYGTNYNIFLNARVLHDFIEENHFKSLVIFASSFGGIAAVDTIARYKQMYPDSDIHIALAFLSSPAGPESLQPMAWLAAQFHANIQIGEATIWLETFMSTMAQGDTSMSDPVTMKDVDINAATTPPTLLHDQTGRILKGMSPLPSDTDIILVYAGDDKDSVVKNQQAPSDIERRLGRPLNKRMSIHYNNEKLNAHAALWWLDYIENNRQPVADTVQLAQQTFGFPSKHISINVMTGLARAGSHRAV